MAENCHGADNSRGSLWRKSSPFRITCFFFLKFAANFLSPVSSRSWTSRTGTGHRCAETGSATTCQPWHCPPRKLGRASWPGHLTGRRKRHTAVPLSQTCNTLPVLFPSRHRSRSLSPRPGTPGWIFADKQVWYHHHHLRINK